MLLSAHECVCVCLFTCVLCVFVSVIVCCVRVTESGRNVSVFLSTVYVRACVCVSVRLFAALVVCMCSCVCVCAHASMCACIYVDFGWCLAEVWTGMQQSSISRPKVWMCGAPSLCQGGWEREDANDNE